MAKRFTDTSKWKRQNFRTLPGKLKLALLYLYDNCDHAGIWHCDFELLSFQINENITEDEFFCVLGDKVQRVSKDKIFIPSFIEFQYGELNSGNRAHQSVIHILKKEGLYKSLTCPIQGAKDKDKDKDKEKEGGVGGEICFDFEKLYAQYPKKVGKVDGLEECKKQIRMPQDYELLRQAVKRYADYMTRPLQPGEFRPEPKHFDTWMRKGRWRECLDPEFGKLVSVTHKTSCHTVESTQQYLAEMDRVNEEAKQVDANKVKALLRTISGKMGES